MMRILGIDLGLTGAIALIADGRLVELHDLPTMLKSGGTVKNQINASALATLLRDLTAGHDKHEHMVLIETVRAMPKQGSASTFSFGHTAGVVEGVIAARALPHEPVTPQAWKKHFRLGAEKEAARALAQRYYPEAPLARVKDHNRAEAILIARYGWEKHA